MTMETVVYSIPPRQKQFMARESVRLGISAAELVRRLIDQHQESLSLRRQEATDGRG